MRSVFLVLLCLSCAVDAGGFREHRSSRGGRLRVAASVAASGFDAGTPSLQYVFPSPARGMPPCTTAENCVASCSIGAVTGSSTAWECVGPTGSAVGTMTDPGGSIIESFNGLAREIVGSDAPRVVSTALDAIFGASTAHTVVLVGFGRSTAPAALPYWLNNNDDPTGEFVMRSQSGDFRCIDYAIVTGAGSANGDDGWSMAACRRSGATSYTADLNVTQFSQTSATPVVGMSGGGSYWFGSRPAMDLYLAGPLRAAVFYSTEKTTSWLDHQRARVWGSYSDAGLVTGANGQLIGFDNTATTGNVDVFYPGAQLVNDGGILTAAAHTNAWAADALSATSWVDVGTPSITSNVSSGPFSAWKKAAECDEIIDDSAAAFEGKQSLTAGTTAQFYNASCYLKAGTTGTTLTKARISITVAGGTGSTDCDFTGLTSTASRRECSALAAGGGITSVKASVLVGNTAAETGSIQACQCQLTATIPAEPPEPDSTAHGSLFYSTVATSWPDPSTGGKYELIHTPLFDPAATWNGPQGTYYIFDASNAGDVDHTVSMIFGYTVPGRLLVVVRNAGTVSDITIDGVSLTPSQLYASAVEWRPVGGGKCNVYVRHNACGAGPASCYAQNIIGSDTTGNATCPEQPAKLTLGNRYDGTVPTTGFISAVRVYP